MQQFDNQRYHTNSFVSTNETASFEVGCQVLAEVSTFCTLRIARSSLHSHQTAKEPWVSAVRTAGVKMLKVFMMF